MNRLTEYDEYGNADIIALSDIMAELYASLSFSETIALTESLNKLAAYEDTGLEPHEAAELKKKTKPLKPSARFPLKEDVKIGNAIFKKNTTVLTHCPACNEWVNGPKKPAYCDNCGQALDWSDINETD